MPKKYKRNIGTYPSRYVMASLTLSLTILGAFGFILLHTYQLQRYIKENIEVQVYLEKNIAQKNIIALKHKLIQKKFLLKSYLPQIIYTSKAEAAKKLIEETGEDFLNILKDNPLQDMFVCKIDPQYQDLQYIQQDLIGISGVAEVSILNDLVKKIHYNCKKISYLLIVFAVILLFMVVILIHNTIKIAMYSQRFLIRTMQLVGAKSSFICIPFIQRSVTIGLWSGLFTNIILLLLLQYAYAYIPYNIQIKCPFQIARMLGSVFFLGLSICVVSTFFITKKYLNMSLSKLY